MPHDEFDTCRTYTVQYDSPTCVAIFCPSDVGESPAPDGFSLTPGAMVESSASLLDARIHFDRYRPGLAGIVEGVRRIYID